MGAGDRLVRGDVLAPAPGPTPVATVPLLGLPVASQCGQQAAASVGCARHTFYLSKLGGKFKPFSLLSGRTSRRQKVGLQGQLGTDSIDAGGEKKPSLERKITGRRATPGYRGPAPDGSRNSLRRTASVTERNRERGKENILQLRK